MIELYNQTSRIIIVLSVVLPVFLALLHYLRIGAKGICLINTANTIQRFSLTERIFHWIRMISFIIVAATGIYFVFHEGVRSAGMTHSINGGIFLLISVFTLFLWFRAGLFKEYDRIWLKNMGGYLSREEKHAPAGKFNAGQKLFFWLSIIFAIILTSTGVNLTRGIIAGNPENGTLLVIHGITAALLIASVIGHIYLSLWVNKGTWRVLTRGKVSEEWAQCHHPNWEYK